MSNDDATMMIDPSEMGLPQVASAPKAKLICIDDSLLDEDQKGLVIELKQSEMILGRGSDCTIPISSARISRNHAKVYSEENGWWIEDLGSTNGISINGQLTKKQRLAVGDEVKLGKLPFKFEIERPALDDEPVAESSPPSPDEDDGDKTMLFSDVRAADALLAAKEEAKKEPIPEKIKPRKEEKKEVASEFDYYKTRKKSSSSKGIIIGLCILVIIAAAGSFLYPKMQYKKAQGTVVSDNQKKIKRFIANYETPQNSGAIDEIDKEIDLLRQISANLVVAAGQFPKAHELIEQQGKVDFFIFERRFLKMIIEDEAEKTADLLAEIKSNFKRLAAINPKATNQVNEIRQLIELADIIAKFKRFKLQYPDSTDKNAPRPDKYRLQELQRLHKTFIDMKKANNLQLSVTFPYFQRMVEDVSEHELRLLDSWEQEMGI
jgi:pSer/pThr/pTyr-binding forkhead associated (FHA) protein